MKFIAILGTVLIFIGCLYLAIRTRFPRPRKEPTPVTPEMLKRNGWSYLIATGAMLVFGAVGFLTIQAGFLCFFELPAGEVNPMYLFYTLGLGMGLAGTLWYLYALYRTIRDLWRRFHPDDRHSWSTRLAWLAVLLTGGVLPALLLWIPSIRKIADRKTRWFGWFWSIVWLPFGIGIILSRWPLAWCFAAGYHLWLVLTFAALAGAAGGKSAPPLPRRVRERFALLAAIPIGVALIAGIAFLWTVLAARAQVKQAERRLAECGAPLTLADITAAFPVPENNAYMRFPELQSAAEAVGRNAAPFAIGALPWPDVYLVSGPNPELQAGLAGIAPALDVVAGLLDRFDPKQSMRFPREWSQGYNMSMPELSTLRSLVGYQCWRIRRALPGGDAAELLKLWKQQQMLQDWARGEGVLIANLVAIAIGEMQLRSAEAILNSVFLSNADLYAMMRQLQEEETEQYAGWQRGLKSEVYFTNRVLSDSWDDVARQMNSEYPGTTELVRVFRKKSIDPDVLPWLLTRNRAFCLNALADLIDWSTSDYYLTAEKLDRQKITRNELPYFLRFYPDMILDILENNFKMNAKEIAGLRVMRTAIAAELYRRKHGAWPEHLTDLVPEFLDAVPIDPFDGQPLRMCQGELDAIELDLKPVDTSSPKQAAAGFEPDEVAEIPTVQPDSGKKFTTEYRPVTRPGFRVYSVGRNQRDDGGKPRPGGSVRDDDDISFTWYREVSGH